MWRWNFSVEYIWAFIIYEKVQQKYLKDFFYTEKLNFIYINVLFFIKYQINKVRKLSDENAM